MPKYFLPFYKHRTTVTEKLNSLDSSAKRCIKRDAESSSKSVTTTSLKRLLQWPVPSKPHASLLVARPQGNSWLPRQPGSQPLPLVESRSPIGTGPELLPSVRSDVTKNQLSFWSASSPSSVLSGRLLRTSRLTSGSSPQLSWLSRRPLRLTLLDSLRTPTCAPFTPNVSPSCLRIFSWPGESGESGPKLSQHRYEIYLSKQMVFFKTNKRVYEIMLVMLTLIQLYLWQRAPPRCARVKSVKMTYLSTAVTLLTCQFVISSAEKFCRNGVYALP